ncbi:MAG: bifunctional sugar-1-phosphate nucleotidylyltransferase/acetyltransferase [Candidatus Freyrarchaeum guaymaensis]|nr:sugar phosphate nucleotidyltransferase [Candidatus Sigynarchaeota archaeon]
MKAVILAAGEGTRLRPLTLTRPKQIFPIAGKPLLEHTLNALKNAGISDVLIVVGYLKEKIIEILGNGEKLGISITYAEQPEVLGTAHAASLAERFVGDQPFLLINGDVITKETTYQGLKNKFEREKPDAVLSVTQVLDPSKYGIVQTENGRVTKIVEKPSQTSPSDYVNAGIYLLPPEIFEAIRETKKSQRGEYEITDSIQLLIDQGRTTLAYEITSYWFDIGHPWDLLDANKTLVEGTEYKIEGEVESRVTIIPPVYIGKNTIVRSGTYIKGPVYIGEDCDIGPNSYIRECTTIGNRCHIGNACEIKNTIILDRTNVAHLSYVGDSIIGENVNLGAGTITANLRLDEKYIVTPVKGKKVDTGRRKLGAMIGDHVKTGIGTTIMPGVKIGPYSLIGPNINLWEDVPERSLVLEKQKLQVKRIDSDETREAD